MQTDDIVSGWLSGADSVGAYANPAGPLYIQGAAATEAAMTNENTGNIVTVASVCTTCSVHYYGCACC